MKLAGWGLFPLIIAKVTSPRNIKSLLEQIKLGHAIARGNGRAYGDSAISSKNTIHMKHFNRMLSFDNKSGQLIVESGVLLADIISVFMPRGWFPAVTPGTKFVTIGGMIAADVHGKNHHKEGSFGNFVDWIDLVEADGNIRRCSRMENSCLFGWTIGGMGLTGVILRAAIRLRPIETGWIKQRIMVAKNINQAIDIFEATMDKSYSVAWIDCMKKGKAIGRSLIMLGEHAKLKDLSKHKQKSPFEFQEKSRKLMPIHLLSWLLSKWSIRVINSFYYWKGRWQKNEKLIDWDSYFYPLDKIMGWNKIYGLNGFIQFQCVIPLSKSRKGLHNILELVTKAGSGSFLAVLKRFGKQDSFFSFPMEGYTLSLDVPVNKRTLKLIDKLHITTLEYGGRFYLAKDSRLTPEIFQKSDKRIKAFRTFREKNKSYDAFNSAQSIRLKL